MLDKELSKDVASFLDDEGSTTNSKIDFNAMEEAAKVLMAARICLLAITAITAFSAFLSGKATLKYRCYNEDAPYSFLSHLHMSTLPFHLRLASWTSLPFDRHLLLFFLIPVCVLLFISALLPSDRHLLTFP